MVTVQDPVSARGEFCHSDRFDQILGVTLLPVDVEIFIMGNDFIRRTYSRIGEFVLRVGMEIIG